MTITRQWDYLGSIDSVQRFYIFFLIFFYMDIKAKKATDLLDKSFLLANTIYAEHCSLITDIAKTGGYIEQLRSNMNRLRIASESIEKRKSPLALNTLEFELQCLLSTQKAYAKHLRNINSIQKGIFETSGKMIETEKKVSAIIKRAERIIQTLYP